MQKTYAIAGITCGGCIATIQEKLGNLSEVEDLKISLEKKEAIITSLNPITLQILQDALPSKFLITPKKEEVVDVVATPELSKLQQLKPLFIIFGYITIAAFLLNYAKTAADGMLDFMGLFFIVFSFFKILDVKGFAQSFAMYDPIAKKVTYYGWVYPFIEVALGLFFLFRYKIDVALIVTIILLGVTTIGVTQTLLQKKQIKCACLGSVLNLPMTQATFIENSIMLVMAFVMLFNLV